MKYIPSIAFEEMSGSAKGVTAAKVRGRKYIRNRGYGGSTRTEFLSSVKGIFKQLSTSWKALSNAQILAWNKLAGTQAGHSVLGSSSKISGANLFMRLNYWIVYCGGEILQAPPTLVGVEAPSLPSPQKSSLSRLNRLLPQQLTFDWSSKHQHLRVTVLPVPIARRLPLAEHVHATLKKSTSRSITRRKMALLPPPLLRYS